MATVTKRKTSLTLSSEALDQAKELGVNVSAVADDALKKAISEVTRAKWLEDNAEAFTAQAEWHETNGHPLSDIMAGPGKSTWRS